ncbi:hypothetical protein OSB04_001587 [Centaurea solstitialis]|uniref:Integrase catalytic domain-containing protein n=1 Tax=Centaurea solstitialis TaxID=347529 RepID=A0AA38U3V9_9ASTR|nr:hypothetical protein OSB04_001587 [Centaurea solstitialis]
MDEGELVENPDERMSVGEAEKHGECETGARKEVQTPPQDKSSWVATTSRGEHMLPPPIEQDMRSPLMQCTTQPSHSSVSQQTVVSSSHGDIPQLVPIPQLEVGGTDTVRQLPPPTTSLVHISSLGPLVSNTSLSLARTQVQTTFAGGFSSPAGTTVVSSAFVAGLQGSEGNPISVNITPTLNMGSLSSTFGSTRSLSDLSVSLPASTIITELRQQSTILGSSSTPIGSFSSASIPASTSSTVPVSSASTTPSVSVPPPTGTASTPNIDLSQTARISALEKQVALLAKGKALMPDPPSQPSHLATDSLTIPELKGLLFSKLLESGNAEDRDLVGVLQQQTLSDRIRGIEETCQVAARRPTRRHDDHDHHEGERKRRRLEGEPSREPTSPRVKKWMMYQKLQSTLDFLSSVQEEIPAEGVEERGVRFSGASSSMSEIDRVLALLENVASDLREYQVTNEEINDARCAEDSKLKDMFDDVQFDFEKEELVEDVEGPLLEEVLPQNDLMPVDQKKVELWEKMKASSGKFLKRTEWNRFTRANGKYLEEKYKSRFCYHERKLSYVKLYGIENLKEEYRREYVHMRKVNKQRREVLVSDYKFVAVKSYKTNKLSAYFYPVIAFTREDGKESEEEIIALTAIVRHVKASISLAHLYDFQLGLENWTSKLFCHKPQRSLIGEEKDFVMYTVFYDADETRISCVYPDSLGNKKRMYSHEVMLFCDDMLKMVMDGLNTRLQMDKHNVHDISAANKVLIKHFVKEIDRRLRLRNDIRFAEIKFKLRKPAGCLGDDQFQRLQNKISWHRENYERLYLEITASSSKEIWDKILYFWKKIRASRREVYLAISREEQQQERYGECTESEDCMNQQLKKTVRQLMIGPQQDDSGLAPASSAEDNPSSSGIKDAREPPIPPSPSQKGVGEEIRVPSPKGSLEPSTDALVVSHSLLELKQSVSETLIKNIEASAFEQPKFPLSPSTKVGSELPMQDTDRTLVLSPSKGIRRSGGRPRDGNAKTTAKGAIHSAATKTPCVDDLGTSEAYVTKGEFKTFATEASTSLCSDLDVVRSAAITKEELSAALSSIVSSVDHFIKFKEDLLSTSQTLVTDLLSAGYADNYYFQVDIKRMVNSAMVMGQASASSQGTLNQMVTNREITAMVEALSYTAHKQNENITHDFLHFAEYLIKRLEDTVQGILDSILNLSPTTSSVKSTPAHGHQGGNDPDDCEGENKDKATEKAPIEASPANWDSAGDLFPKKKSSTEIAKRKKDKGKEISRAPLPGSSSDDDAEIDDRALSDLEDEALIATIKESKAMATGKLPPHRPPKVGEGPSTRPSSVPESFAEYSKTPFKPELVDLDTEQRYKLGLKTKHPDMVASNKAIIKLKRVSPRTLYKKPHAYTEYSVIGQDNTKYIFIDADLHNLNPYDLSYLHGMLAKLMESKNSYASSRRRVAESIFTTPLIQPSWVDTVPHNKVIIEPQHGFTYIDENGTLKFFDPTEAHKYSNTTLFKIYGVMAKEIDEGRLTREEIEGFLQSIRIGIKRSNKGPISSVGTGKLRFVNVFWTGLGVDIVLTKSAHFIAIWESSLSEVLADIYVKEIVSRHGKFHEDLGTRLQFTIAFHPQTDGQSKRTIQTLEDMLWACVLDFGGSWDTYLSLVEFSYNSSFRASIGMPPYEMLYVRRCRTPICLEEKSYADKKRSDLEFLVGDDVLLKVSPWKGVIWFRKRAKLGPRFIGPFKVIARVGKVAYLLELLLELGQIHNTFHVSQLTKCLADEMAHVPIDDIQVDEKLNYIERPIAILERKTKSLRNKKIGLIGVICFGVVLYASIWLMMPILRFGGENLIILAITHGGFVHGVSTVALRSDKYGGNSKVTVLVYFLCQIRILISEESPDTDKDQGSLYPDDSSGCHTNSSSLLSLTSVFRSRACCHIVVATLQCGLIGIKRPSTSVSYDSLGAHILRNGYDACPVLLMYAYGLSQGTYIDKVLKRYRMDESKKGFTSMQSSNALSMAECLVSSPMPDVAYSVSITSRYQHNLGFGGSCAKK